MVLGQLVENVLETLLEVTAVLGTSQQPGHVERQHALALEGVGHLAGDDALGQSFDDGRLAHTGFADQHRIVLGAPLEHLQRAADLVIAPDHGIELALAGALGQVERVFLERTALFLGIGTVHCLSSSYRFDRGFEILASQPVLAGHITDAAARIGHCQKKQLSCKVLVSSLDGFFLNHLQ